jgi:uncharacterized protein with PIN domain
MKFIADVMLGRLAKRMRLLGFDVLYDRALDDNELLHRSLENDRVLLTRDALLAARPLASNHLIIVSDFVQEQLGQVLSAFPREALHPLTRCSECNAHLDPIGKQDARDLVPRHVYDTMESFLHCPRCGRIYWNGTHVQKMALPG